MTYPSRREVLDSLSRVQDKTRILRERAQASLDVDLDDYASITCVCERILELTSFLHDQLVKE